MSKDKVESDGEVSAAKPKGGKLKKLLFGVIALAAIGGGSAAGALYLVNGSLTPHPPGAEAEDENRPELVARDEASAEEVRAATRRAQRGRPDPRVFKATYIPIEDNFTANLMGADSFVQVGIGLSTYYDERVVANVETHKMAVRSAVLMTLSETDPTTINSTGGKELLQRRLTAAINQVLTDREGFGGIDGVYFTSFVAQ
jgi:flagellar protein FliL